VEVPVGRWADAISVRRSRRAFDGVSVAGDLLDALDEVCRSFRPFPEVRTVLLSDAPADIFTGLVAGLVGSYGRVTGAPSALLFIGVPGPKTPERIGYTGEGAVLEATALGAGTCWVGGAFDRRRAAGLADLAEDERVFAVSPVGTPLAPPAATERLLFGAGKEKRRRPLDIIAPGREDWPRWAIAGVEAARVAPSALNRQPWRFSLVGGDVLLKHAGPDTPGSSKRLDCGIAMLHFEIAAHAAGSEGAWGPGVDGTLARWAEPG